MRLSSPSTTSPQRLPAFIVAAGLTFTVAINAMSLTAAEPVAELQAGFEKHVQPFLKQHCVRCHNPDEMMSGIRVDQLNAAVEDRHIKLWDGIRRQISGAVMPPEDEPQPTQSQREEVVRWIERALDVARSRPTPKNGSVRRLTVAQYRNTLRELLLLDDELADVLPPDAVSREGFVNNQETLALSPLLLETYFEIAEKALDRCIVDVQAKPTIQNFRMDLGAAINTEPCPDNLILGADSLLLNNADFRVTQLNAQKPFAFEPFVMPSKFRFIEGYQGNDTVRGWRDFDSIYHAVFACMRGVHGYPKGLAYSTIPQGLLLRPAIPSEEIFGLESTYGPRANFKISLRELPDGGRFRVTVTAAKYDDGLLLDPGTAIAKTDHSLIVREPQTASTVMLPQAGIYQVDAHLLEPDQGPIVLDGSKLSDGLIGAWPLAGTTASLPEREEFMGRLTGEAKFVESPFGKAVSLDGNGDAVMVPHHESLHVGAGDFTVAAWIHPLQLRQAGIVCLGKYSWTHGWYLDMPNNQGVLRIETVGPQGEPNGTVQSPPGTLKNDAWQHVAAVVRRGDQPTQLFVNGYPVAKGTIGTANLDNPKVDLFLGRIQDAHQFRGNLSDVRLYRRALRPEEIQALVEPGRKFAPPPPREKPQDLTLALGEREFIGTLNQPAFLAVRLPAGPLPLKVRYPGNTLVDRLVLTPLPAEHAIAERFAVFETRRPRVGVHVGLRRDCGSTLSPVGPPQTVSHTELKPYIFEGAIRNFPSPDVEKDNVNYLAGIREIGVRSEFTDGRDMPRLLIRSIEFEGPLYDAWPPTSHRNLFIDFDRKNDQPAYAQELLRQFATRAFRRPVSKDEEQALFAVYAESAANGADFPQAVKDALQVTLTSPQFLFLIENSPGPEAQPLDNFELASKLSYFLWNGPPDVPMFNLAAAGELHRQLDSEVTRMVDDPRFDRFLNEFTSQWLALDKFAVLEPSRERFPKLTRDNRTQLRQEPMQFIKHLIRHNLSVKNLIEADFIVANEVVASYYDLANQTETGFDFAPLTHGRRDLGGVLSQAAILAGLSDGRESNPVKRGAWLARRIIAEPPDDPPPNVPMVKDDPQLSLRERLERHRNQPGCLNCHSKIDPWGVPFEEFDAGGRWKSQPTDARSTLPDQTEVAGFHGLQRYLAEDRLDQVAFSVLKHLTIYATGRNLSYSEVEFLKRDCRKLKPAGYRLRDMLQYVVHSEAFLTK